MPAVIRSLALVVVAGGAGFFGGALAQSSTSAEAPAPSAAETPQRQDEAPRPQELGEPLRLQPPSVEGTDRLARLEARLQRLEAVLAAAGAAPRAADPGARGAPAESPPSFAQRFEAEPYTSEGLNLASQLEAELDPQDLPEGVELLGWECRNILCQAELHVDVDPPPLARLQHWIMNGTHCAFAIDGTEGLHVLLDCSPS